MADAQETAMTDETLAARIDRAQTHALSTGALLPVEMETRIIRDSGVDFEVTWLSSLALKDLAGKMPRAGDRSSTNPFLPFEQDLHVADLSETHVAILNKFQSMPGHLVIITRAFEAQSAPLDRADLAACVDLLAEEPGLVFFNSGPDAGASQSHRHLQFLPGFNAPVAGLVEQPETPWVAGRAAALPFAHRLYGLPADAFDGPAETTDRLTACLRDAYAALNFGEGPVLPGYNLLMTRDWFMVIPRRVETVAGVSMAALGFAGVIGLRSVDQFAAVESVGPMAMLVAVAGSAEA
jgi:ATP adenylyltransferase